MPGLCLAFEYDDACWHSKAETIRSVFCSKYEHSNAFPDFHDNKSDDNLNVSNLHTEKGIYKRIIANDYHGIHNSGRLALFVVVVVDFFMVSLSNYLWIKLQKFKRINYYVGLSPNLTLMEKTRAVIPTP